MRKIRNLHRAVDWLPFILSEGPVVSSTIYAAGALRGLSQDVLRKAATQLGISSTSLPVYPFTTVWSLPESEEL